MAGIDHTIIAFKNGMLLRETSVSKPDGSCVPLIPFSYSRDGEIRGYEMLGYNQTPSKGRVRSALKGIFRRHDRSDKTYFFYADKDVEIILVKSEEYCATFYLDWQNTYVLLGGYGHHRNPYTHFYHRGYGEQFERKLSFGFGAAYGHFISSANLEVYEDFIVEDDEVFLELIGGVVHG